MWNNINYEDVKWISKSSHFLFSLKLEIEDMRTLWNE